MAKTRNCDVCGKVAQIVAKLYLSPVGPGGVDPTTLSSYTSHMDVGVCCVTNVRAIGKWQRRTKRPRKKKEDAV